MHATEGLPLPTCDVVRASAPRADTIGDVFYARYPKRLTDPEAIDAVALSTAEIDNIVQYLSCMAALTHEDPVVADNALSLFASKRHGASALDRLAALARADTADGRDAHAFARQMRAYLKGPAN